MSAVATPPETTLSTPSPTEADPSLSQSQNPFHPMLDTPSGMSTVTAARPIYMVVATALSPPMGIGVRGALPWPQIKKDMAFFRSVTSSSSTMNSSARNVVLMGRKTWESIPPRFRPLPGRLNVVLTRADTDGLRNLASRIRDELSTKGVGSESNWSTQSLNVEIGDIVKISEGNREEVVITNSLQLAASIHKYCGDLGQSFCIGGAEIYGMILRNKDLRPRIRVLQTLVKKTDGGEFECDTFWPERLEDGKEGWHQVDLNELQTWIGNTSLPQGTGQWYTEEKAGVDIRVVAWKQLG